MKTTGVGTVKTYAHEQPTIRTWLNSLEDFNLCSQFMYLITDYIELDGWTNLLTRKSEHKWMAMEKDIVDYIEEINLIWWFKKR